MFRSIFFILFNLKIIVFFNFSQRVELADLIRSDFKANKNINNSDENTIKSLIFHGERMLKELNQTINFTKSA